MGFIPQILMFSAIYAGYEPRRSPARTMMKRRTKARGGAAGLREGEIAIALPEQFDASIFYIGRIRTPWKRRQDCPKNPSETDAACTIVLDPRWKQGLRGLESVSHVVVLYWMDRARRDLVLQMPHHYAEGRGTFALRSPVRPNPIAVSVARLVTSKTIGSPSLGWIVSTTRRSSTSSRISPRPIRCRTLKSGGTRAEKSRFKTVGLSDRRAIRRGKSYRPRISAAGRSPGGHRSKSAAPSF